jgi:ankyrin repeat protein
MEAAKSDGEAKAITTTSVATTSQEANLDLLEAAKSDDETTAVAALTQSGVDVNCRENSGYHLTPLMLAIQLMNLKVARVLLADPRVDVNATDTSGLTALHRATGKRLRAIILSQRTDIDWNVADKTGRTPLLRLARMNCLRNIQELSRIKSVELFARSIDEFTALHEVAERESPFPAWF